MDWIQIYYAVNIVLGIVIIGCKALVIPNKPYSPLTNSERFIAHILIGIPLALPYMGRIFGWW